MSLFRKLAGQTGIYGLSSIVGRLLNYLLVPLYTRQFLTTEYGIVTELYAYVGFLLVLMLYGMETGYFRFVSKEASPTKVYNTILSTLISSTLFIGALLLLFSGKIAQTLDYPGAQRYVIYFILILVLDVMAAIPFAKLRNEERAKRFALIKLAGIGVNIGLNLLLILVLPRTGLLVPKIEFIFLANLIASGLTLVLLAPEFRIWKFEIDRALLSKTLRYCAPLIFVGLAYVVNEMIDRVLLRYYLEGSTDFKLSQIGIYGACYKISIFLTLFVQAFRYAAEPFFFNQAKERNAAHTYAIVMKYFAIAATGILLFILVFLDLFKLFIGSAFHEGLVVVPILLFANLMLGYYYNLSVWYKLKDKTYWGAIISSFGAILTISLNILWIPKWGYVGSAWATLIAYGTMVVLSYVIGRKHYPIPYNVPKLLLYTLGVLLYWRLLLWVESLLELGGGALYVMRILALIFYAVLIFLFEKSTASKPKQTL